MNDDEIDLPYEDDDPQPRKRRGWKVALISLGIVGCLVLAAGAVVGWYVNSLNSSYEKRSTVSVSRGPSDTAPERAEGGRNILLLGSDERNAEDAEEEDVSGQRSDVMMLVHVPEDGDGVYIMSFPRDLYVEIPGQGQDRINAALAFDGIPGAVATVEDYVGVPVDHVALIDFDGIEGMVDTLGGVDVNVEQDFESGGFEYTSGTMHLSGEEALAFVRERKSFADGDFARNRNQQELLRGLANKVISADTLSDPRKISALVEDISPYLTTDEDLTGSTLVGMGLDMRSVRGGDLHFMSVPHGDPYTTSGGASVVATDEDGMDELREALASDDMEAYYESNG